MEAVQAITIFLGTHGARLALSVGVGLASAALAFGTAAYVLVRIPEDYFDKTEIAPFLPGRPRWLQQTAKIGKNVLGAAVIAGGAVLAMPGVAGPGVLTMLLGLSLLDIPGKRNIQRRVLGRPKVLAMINRLRSRFDRPPLRIHIERSSAVVAAG